MEKGHGTQITEGQKPMIIYNGNGTGLILWLPPPMTRRREIQEQIGFQEMDNVSVSQQCQWVCQLPPFVIRKGETLVALKISECFPHNI
jgi:hypothetical protein